jgi:hypothetical protein
MSEKQFKEALRKKAGQRLRGRLRAIQEKFTIADIESAIENLRVEGFHTGALIVDYPDLMTATKARDEKRYELADLSRELRRLGGKLGIPVWGASQATRESFYRETITAAAVAEAIEKVAVADVLITLCQTREEEELSQGRLFMAKVRRRKSHDFFPVKINFEHQAIVTKMSGKVE